MTEAEEQTKFAQSKLAKGIKESVAEVSVVEVDKAKPGGSKHRCKFCNRIGHGKNPEEKTRKKLCKLGRLVSNTRRRVTLPMFVKRRRRTPRAMLWPQ